MKRLKTPCLRPMKRSPSVYPVMYMLPLGEILISVHRSSPAVPNWLDHALVPSTEYRRIKISSSPSCGCAGPICPLVMPHTNTPPSRCTTLAAKSDSGVPVLTTHCSTPSASYRAVKISSDPSPAKVSGSSTPQAPPASSGEGKVEPVTKRLEVLASRKRSEAAWAVRFVPEERRVKAPSMGVESWEGKGGERRRSERMVMKGRWERMARGGERVAGKSWGRAGGEGFGDMREGALL
mmetsp:Transcript_10719/g.26906  ORF Transcript_10719/g.26906 Transcript_10719/m.26906 type:complete len:237 (-) Transcript_10719:44-754(-)